MSLSQVENDHLNYRITTLLTRFQIKKIARVSINRLETHDNLEINIYLTAILGILTVKFKSVYYEDTLLSKCFILLEINSESTEFAYTLFMLAYHCLCHLNRQKLRYNLTKTEAKIIVELLEKIHKEFVELEQRYRDEMQTNIQRPQMVFNHPDTILKILMIIWLITNQDHRNCRLFVNNGILALLSNLLQSLNNEVLLQVVGILTNLCEVKEIRPNIVITDIPKYLYSCLFKNEELSYISKISLAFLLIEGQTNWMIPEPSYSQVLDTFEQQIRLHGSPNLARTVTFTSLNIFEQFLILNSFPIKLWAFWMINMLCTNDKRTYIPLLSKGTLYVTLKKQSRYESDPIIQEIIRNIDSLIDSSSYKYLFLRKFEQYTLAS